VLNHTFLSVKFGVVLALRGPPGPTLFPIFSLSDPTLETSPEVANHTPFLNLLLLFAPGSLGSSSFSFFDPPMSGSAPILTLRFSSLISVNW